MQIGEVRATFPILRFESRVRHYTPRRPTVFERAILRLHRRFAENPACNSIPLQKIFEDILCVADADRLVGPSLNNLVALGVFRCRTEHASLPTTTLKDLELTPDGVKMEKDDMLPAREVTHSVKHDYDPIRKVVLNGEKWTRRENPSPAHVSSEPFAAEYPAIPIQEKIPLEAHPWWSPSTQIRNVERVGMQIGWREHPGTVQAGESGALTVEFKDAAYTAYVNKLQGDALADRLIRPALSGGSDISVLKDTAEVDFAEVRAERAVCSFLEAALKGMNLAPGRAHFMNAASGLVEVPAEAPSGTLVVVYGCGAGDSSGAVEWNKAQDGALLRLPDPFPIAGCLYCCSDGGNLYAGNFRFNVNGRHVSLPLGFARGKESLNGCLASLVTDLEDRLKGSPRIEDLLALSLWHPPEHAWNLVVSRVRSQGSTFAEAIDTLKALRGRFLKLKKMKAVASWDGDILGILTARLEGIRGSIPHATLREYLLALRLGEVTAVKRATESIEGVLSMAASASDPKDLEATLDALEAAAPGFRAEAIERLYTTEILRQYFDEFPKADLERRLNGRTRWETRLRELKTIESALKRIIPCADLTTFDTEERYQATIKSVKVEQAIEGCDRWSQCFASMRQSDPLLNVILNGTTLESLHRNITGYRSYLDRLTGGPVAGHGRVCVVDTNVFIDRPDILSCFGSSDLIVVSKKVVDELDALKQNPKTGTQASLASKALNQHGRANLRFEGADVTLLPQEYRRSPDNLILSVALKFRRHDPVLLTSDNNLSVKAKAEGIRVMSLDAFIHQEPARPKGTKKGRG